MVFTNLAEGQHGNFTVLVAALKNHLGNSHQAELNRAHLHSHVNKSLPELAEDVEHLAYPGAAEEMIVVNALLTLQAVVLLPFGRH